MSHMELAAHIVALLTALVTLAAAIVNAPNARTPPGGHPAAQRSLI